ncbi:hypothetical protein [Streptomyces sp. NPDC058964]|uniref:hypothetical protein n=1 Tax=Streptomyces sp. NPDC058964 TaxID=3346681 RepID=UPI003675715A
MWKYCERVLDAAGDESGDEGRGGDGQGDGTDHGGRGDRDDRDGHRRGEDGRRHDGGNDHHQDGGFVLPVPSALAPVLPARPTRAPVPSPSSTYSAL